MNVEVHLLSYNEQDILPYTIRHYATYASRIILHDAFSTDGTRRIAMAHDVEIENWDTQNQINDKLAVELKNTAWLKSTADWVIMADADELIYFPGGLQALYHYEEAEVCIVKPHGFELCSPVFPTTKGQIYDEIKLGAPDDKWYAKPIMLSPKRVKSVSFAMGAHGCRAVLKNGLVIVPREFSNPPAYLLHCKHLGPIERVAKEYASDLKRLSPINKKYGWGNQGDGLKHATEKRMGILANLQRIIPE